MLVFDSFLGAHYYDKREEKAAIKVIQSKSLFRYDGPNLLKMTEEFEQAVSVLLGLPYVIACSSGTAALKMSCVALDIGVGDEVIMSPYTFISSAAAVLSCGAIPKFVDIDESFNIDTHKIEEAITDKTKAIMAIHIQGVPCHMEPIMDIAEKYGISIIEDAAQAFYSFYNGQATGSFGNVSAFSLQENKVITCGEGGIFCCKDKAHYNRAKMYHDNGGIRIGDNYPTWEHPESSFGENYKITELQSAVALEQLKKVDMIAKKQQTTYEKLRHGIHNKKFHYRKIARNINAIYPSLCLIFNEKKENDNFITYLNNKQIKARYSTNKPIHAFNTFKNRKSWHSRGFPYSNYGDEVSVCQYTQELYERSAWIPLSPLLGESDIDYIINVINSY